MNAPQATPNNSPNTPPDLRGLYHSLRERCWVIALTTLVALALAALYLARAQRIYAARVVMQVEQEEQKVLNVQRVQQEDLQSLEWLRTIEQMLQSRALLARVVDALQLGANPRFGRLGKASREELISALARTLEVKLRKGTRLIDITVEHTDPELARQIATAVMDEYLRESVEYAASTSQSANSFLLSEARKLEIRLEQSENALQDYKETLQSVSLEDRQNIVVQQLRDLSATVTEARSQLLVQQSTARQIENAGTNTAALLFIPAIANDAAVADLRREIARQESDIASLRERYKEKHPKLIQARGQLAKWKEALADAIVGSKRNLQSTYDNAQLTLKSLEAMLRDQENAALGLNKQSIRYNVLARDVESDKAMYQAVLTRIKETDVTKDLRLTKVRVVQSASTPEKPVKPNRAAVPAIAGLGGVGAGFLLVLLLTAMDRSFKTIDDIESTLDLPALTAIRKMRKADRGVFNSADASGAESFRTLRTCLSIRSGNDPSRVVLFTSAVPQEGKTFCSLKYAASLASQGLRTVVIDCDLRRPMIERSLCPDQPATTGMVELLSNQASFDSVVRSTADPNFYFISAGTAVPNPAELLASRGIDAIIDAALSEFDRVIIDSAPIHAVSDTLLLLERVHAVCLVVRSHHTPRGSVRRAIEMLKEAGAPIGGVILNLLPRTRSVAYRYDSYYEYGYRGHYGEALKSPAAK